MYHNLAEYLGYPKRTKLLIVHADDLGMARSINSAILDAMAAGSITSASIMAVCPFFSEALQYAQKCSADIGIHLTLNSDTVHWRPILSPLEVPSLVGADGCFFEKWDQDLQPDLFEIEAELRAQIETLLTAGLDPTHLDCHRFVLYRQGQKYFELLLRLGHDYGIPVVLGRNWFTKWSHLVKSISDHDLVLDHIFTIQASMPAKAWATYYSDVITNLLSGVTEIIIHPAYADEEMTALCASSLPWGADWRQRDLDFFVGDEIWTLIESEGVQLTTWRKIRELALGD